MQRAIEKHLNQVIGLPLWGIGRAASLLWLQFGERRTVPAWGGGTKEVGSFALHIDCPWSWKRDDQVIADEGAALEGLKKLVSPPIVCRMVTAQASGSFELRFDNGTKFVVCVEEDSDPNADEYWRLLEPALDTAHFVVGARGVST
jgi:hypothetical protein